MVLVDQNSQLDENVLGDEGPTLNIQRLNLDVIDASVLLLNVILVYDAKLGIILFMNKTKLVEYMLSLIHI